MNNRSLGNAGEKLAVNYLLAQGYKIIQTNFYNPKGYRWGEIDIITQAPDDSWVFVEVKSRQGKREQWVPGENLTNLKIDRIIKTAQFYLKIHELLDVSWRIDLVAIIFDFKTRRFCLQHIKCIHK